jgi:hypothetical protein
MYTDYTFSALELTGKVENSHPHLHPPPASMGERDDLWLKPRFLFQLTAFILWNDFVG